MERLDKVISNLTCISRTDARRLIKIGKVSVDGVRAKSFSQKVDGSSKICVDGKELKVEDHVYIMLNKSAGFVCDDKAKFPYVLELLPDDMRRKDLFCVGRLDKDTTGLLLITNDGEFAHKVISPKSNVFKRYCATLEKPISQSDIKRISAGLTLSDGTELLPAMVEVKNSEGTQVDFVIQEGKYHQIKRMAGACENKVLSLHRKSIGALSLGETADGQAVYLDKFLAQKVFE